MIRNKHRRGDHLVLDDESGFVEYASNTQRIWDGTIRHRRNYEDRNPQEFVHALADPKGIADARPEPAYPVPINVQPAFAGNTTIPFVNGPASHLFGGNGIEAMIVEDDIEPFVVAPD